MTLNEFVPRHFMLQRIHVSEEFRGSEFAGVKEGMGCYVVVGEELFL
jgi:hypothetical protein